MTTRKLVITALLTALICAFTLFPSIPVPATGGYVHAGDAVIFAAVYLTGIYAVPAAAIGSALADIIIGGAAIFAPATFIIKALMALVCFCLFRARKSMPFFLIGCVLAECIMAAGYFAYETALFGLGTAVSGLPFNALQAAAGVLLGTVLYLALKSGKVREKIFPEPL